MKRSRNIWIAFVGCLAVVLAAMGWISLKALQLDETQAEAWRLEALARQAAEQAQHQAALEQEIRFALTNMDVALMPLVFQENARPYFVYDTFLKVDRPFRQMFNDDAGSQRMVPSPLLKEESPDVLVHFQFEPDGQLTSPQVPSPGNGKLAVPDHISSARVAEAEAQLARVAKLVDRDDLLAMLPDRDTEELPFVILPLAQLSAQQQRAQEEFRNDVQLRGRDLADYNRRSQTVQNAGNFMLQVQRNNLYGSNTAVAATDVSGVPMSPLCIDGQLILARRVSVRGREYVQGCLLNWPEIKHALLLTVEDQLPEADLVPVSEVPKEGGPCLLSALPVRLIPGKEVSQETVRHSGAPGTPPGDQSSAGTLSPIQLSLLTAWGCVLLAAVAVDVLLAGVIRLSERRAAFVSAVTHELRTPLTTFHMYTEMLAEGMVPDEGRRQTYLGTLRSEASRLSHLVENVLSYARLERGRADGRIENVALGDLVQPVEHRLADRARQAGMEVVVESGEEVLCTQVQANRSAVEQILFNLVDNAGKYAAGADDKRIHLTLEQSDGSVRLRVRDHGPGISGATARRLFRSFSKSAHDAANSAPGVGLGLALSRRLARD
ncbi:MAG: sensor histidine kinase, partial [Planctomycetota bacterium]